MHAILPLLRPSSFPPIRRDSLETLQVNLGYRCNQSCVHCHVAAGPTRREMMDRPNVDVVLDFLSGACAMRLDLTGGAPEMNPHFRYLVRGARDQGAAVIDRCNLTILQEPGYGDLSRFLAEQGVEVVASLPCYSEDNVDAQRGSGVFERSIRGLKSLNDLGYGHPGSGLMLNLVYNPQGPTLPPSQPELEEAYRRELGQRYGIVFNRLFALVNMPLQRFGSTLISHGGFDSYMTLLRDAHRSENVEHVMCRRLLSVDWQGFVYDCDFNQMLGLPLIADQNRKVHLRDLMGVDLTGRPIAIAEHCYGCTAGSGSSCGGSLTAVPKTVIERRPPSPDSHPAEIQ